MRAPALSAEGLITAPRVVVHRSGVLASRFVFTFGPAKAGHYRTLANRELRTSNRTPNLNTNREGRSRNRERHVLSESRHLVGDAPVRVAADDAPEVFATRRDGRREEALLGPALAD